MRFYWIVRTGDSLNLKFTLMTKRLFLTWKELCCLIQKRPSDCFSAKIPFPIFLLEITFSVHLCEEGRWQFYFEALLTKKKRLNPYDIAPLTFEVRENLSFTYCNTKASKQNSNPNLAWSACRFLARHITQVNLKIQSQLRQKRDSLLLQNRLEKYFSGP